MFIFSLEILSAFLYMEVITIYLRENEAHTLNNTSNDIFIEFIHKEFMRRKWYEENIQNLRLTREKYEFFFTWLKRIQKKQFVCSFIFIW